VIKSHRILYITPFFNYPPRDGASLRSVRLFECLIKQNDVDILTYNNKSISIELLERFSQSTFHFFKSSFEAPKKLSFLQRLFSKSLPGFASHASKSIANDIDKIILKNGHYDIIYFSTQLMGQAKLHLNSRIYSIIDLYDIYTAYSISKYKNLELYRLHYWLFRIEAIRIKRLEQKIFNIFDLICATCEENVRRVKIMKRDANVIEISNGTISPKAISKDRGNSLLMVGNFEYSGNLEGIKWFLEKVWSSLKDKTDSTLTLVGKYPDHLKQLVAKDKKIHLTGLVSDLSPYYSDAGCVILPLFNDGGTKTKLIEAMSYGIPIVSTNIGAKGFELIETIYKTDDPKVFSEYILKVIKNDYQNESLNSTKKFVIENYSWEVIGRKLNYFLKNIPLDRVED